MENGLLEQPIVINGDEKKMVTLGNPILIIAETEDEYNEKVKKAVAGLTSNSHRIKEYKLGIIVPINRQKVF
jgi:hypothetical protein